jgi:hypothetical protein
VDEGNIYEIYTGCIYNTWANFKTDSSHQIKEELKDISGNQIFSSFEGE